jgi:NhaP-type Na+/H+ or K+/H+ antiporter
VDFIDSLMVKIALIGLLGIGAQWIAWRTGKPAIALMMLAGLIAGPVTGIVVPERDFGALLEPIVKLAVAVILFDGGLSLRFREIRQHGGAILALVLVGVPVGWALGTAAAYYGAGLPLGISALFGGIMVVTGPTVVGPLLRNLNIGRRPAQILKWEAIVNDPIGALLAVFIFAWITYEGAQVSIADIAVEIAVATAIAAAIGVLLAVLVVWLFPRGHVPEYLKAPALLVLVIGGFVLADTIYHETGLVTVTVMGLVIANRPIYSFSSLRRFKEDLGVLLVSGIFILLPATLDWDVMRAFEARFLVFLLLLLFVVRPLTVFVSLIFSRVPWRERLFIAWIAPRGVVAVAITGLFALRLGEYGAADAVALIPLSFGVVIATIVAHGFSAGWVARRLGLDKGPGRAVLIVGANRWTVELAACLRRQGLAVTVADPSPRDLRLAQEVGLDTWHGDLLDEVTDDHLDLSAFQQLIAATDNPAYNALICSDLGPEMGFDAVAQVGVDRDRPPLPNRGRVLFGDDGSIDALIARGEVGWHFDMHLLGDRRELIELREQLPKGTIFVAVLRGDGRLVPLSAGQTPPVNEGDRLIVYRPPPTAAKSAGI